MPSVKRLYIIDNVLTIITGIISMSLLATFTKRFPLQLLTRPIARVRVSLTKARL